MNISTPIWLETLYIRLRTSVSTLLRLVGVVLIAFGAYNMFVVGLENAAVDAAHRQIAVMRVSEYGVYYVGDVVVMAIGAALAWFA